MAVLMLDGIAGLCIEARYKGYIDLTSFALCPPEKNAADQSFCFSFVTAFQECIPQLSRKWSERIVLQRAELVVFSKDDNRQGIVLFQARMESVSLASIRIICGGGADTFVPRAAVDAHIGSLDLGIGVEMCDGWNSVGGLASVRFQWKVEEKMPPSQ